MDGGQVMFLLASLCLSTDGEEAVAVPLIVPYYLLLVCVEVLLLSLIVPYHHLLVCGDAVAVSLCPLLSSVSVGGGAVTAPVIVLIAPASVWRYCCCLILPLVLSCQCGWRLCCWSSSCRSLPLFRYLEEAVLNLDVAHPVTREHMGSVLQGFQRNMNMYLLTNPNHKKVKMLLMAVNHMAASQARLSGGQAGSGGGGA